MNFVGRPDKACSTDRFKRNMQHIFIHENNMIATDGNILVSIPLQESELIGNTQLLNGFYINPRQYREILSYDIAEVVGEGELLCHRLDIGYKTRFILTPESAIGKFPNYKSVTEYKYSEETPVIGVSYKILQKLLSCFDGLTTTGHFKMMLQQINKSIHFRSTKNENVFGFIMPINLDIE